MNFPQWRAILQAVRSDFNLTVAAEALHLSQSGVSRQIREFEEELGTTVFLRHGKRLIGLTAAGQAILPRVERVLFEADAIKRVRDSFFGRTVGTLTIAATHTQARYALPPVVKDFTASYPDVRVTLLQGTAAQVAGMLVSGEADIGIATEVLADHAGLVSLPCYRWTHSVVVPRAHALARMRKPLTLDVLAALPLITYETGYAGRTHVDAAFARRGLIPDVVVAAMDADVIKTYVTLGMGAGILASIAFDAARDSGLVAIDAGHLFDVNVTQLAVRAGTSLAGYMYAFIESFAPSLAAELLKAQQNDSDSPSTKRSRRATPGLERTAGIFDAAARRSREPAAKSTSGQTRSATARVYPFARPRNTEPDAHPDGYAETA
jgi:LysR family cys regulon transcriptional activator